MSFDNITEQCVIKIMLLGNQGVGKTSLLMRFMENKFSYSPNSTIGIDFKEKIISHNYLAELTGNSTLDKDIDIRLQIWDSTGQEQFKTITESFYRRSEGIILIYDITDMTSYTDLIHWLQGIENRCYDGMPVIILGNKQDLDVNRVIDSKLGNNFAQRYKLEHYEVSAATDSDIVNEIFFKFTYRCYIAKKNRNNQVTGSFYLKQNNKKLHDDIEDHKCC